MSGFWKKFVHPRPEGFHVHRVLDFVRNCVLSIGVCLSGWKMTLIESSAYPLNLVFGYTAIGAGLALLTANVIWIGMAGLTALEEEVEKPTTTIGKGLVLLGILVVVVAIYAMLSVLLNTNPLKL
jgi:hypothetical protein